MRASLDVGERGGGRRASRTGAGDSSGQGASERASRVRSYRQCTPRGRGTAVCKNGEGREGAGGQGVAPRGDREVKVRHRTLSPSAHPAPSLEQARSRPARTYGCSDDVRGRSCSAHGPSDGPRARAAAAAARFATVDTATASARNTRGHLGPLARSQNSQIWNVGTCSDPKADDSADVRVGQSERRVGERVREAARTARWRRRGAWEHGGRGICERGVRAPEARWRHPRLARSLVEARARCSLCARGVLVLVLAGAAG